MPNPYKNKRQPRARGAMPDNKPGVVLRKFLDKKESSWYPGHPIGNTEFVAALGYNAKGSQSCYANQWMKGKPIPDSAQIVIKEVFPDFPLAEYLRAYREEYGDGKAPASFRIVLLLLEEYLKGKEFWSNEYRMEPSRQISSEKPEMLLEDPYEPFNEEVLADKSRYESPDPSKEEKEAAWDRAREAINRHAKKD